MVLAASMRVLARVLAPVLAVLAVSCGSNEAQPLVVGAAESAESRVLAEIYAQALARTGAAVRIEPGLRGRSEVFAALDAGDIAVTADHNGALLAVLNTGAEAPTSDKVTEELNGSLPQGTITSDPAEGADFEPRVLVTTATAQQRGIESVEQLGAQCPSMVAGVAVVPDLFELPEVAGKISGCEFASTEVFSGPEELHRALLEGRVQAGVLGGPAEFLSGGTEGLKVLADPEDAIRPENPLALVRKGALDDRELEKLNYVAGELTTDELATLVSRVRDEAADPGELARTWLDAHGL